MLELDATCTHIRQSNRARHLSITVRHDGAVVLTVPRRATRAQALTFLRESAPWIQRQLAVARRIKKLPVPERSGRHFDANRSEALERIRERIESYSKAYGFCPSGLAVRNQRSRWGSCSKKGRLSFSYKLMFLPPQLMDYVIVHELCHLKHFNHSKAFWNLVESILPDWRIQRAELHTYRP